tara:strand:- start:72 stop:467 length:396 start_codon:yes stop_codon:yes gene_type:complete
MDGIYHIETKLGQLVNNINLAKFGSFTKLVMDDIYYIEAKFGQLVNNINLAKFGLLTNKDMFAKYAQQALRLRTWARSRAETGSSVGLSAPQSDRLDETPFRAIAVDAVGLGGVFLFHATLARRAGNQFAV